MAYEDFKDLPKRAASDKVLHGEAIHILKNPKYDGYQRGLASVVYKCFDKRSARGKGLNSNFDSENQQLDQELHKSVIRKFEKHKVYSSFKDKIWDADLADIQLISKYNRGVKCFICIIDIFSKYALVVPFERQ